MKRNHLRLSCPHCGSYLAIRSSVGITPAYREAYVHCTNVDECGFRGKMEMEMTYTLCPSSKPNPQVNIPASPWLLSQLLPDCN